MDFAPFRLAAFILGLAIFPAGVPRISRAALGIALLLFCSPLFSGGGVLATPAAAASWVSRFASTGGGSPIGAAYTELTVGFVIGVALSMAARAVSLIAAWCTTLIFPSFAGFDRSDYRGLNCRLDRKRIELLIGLVFVVSIMDSGAFDRIAELAARSFIVLPAGAASKFAASGMRGLLLDLVDASVLLAICSTAPIFFLFIFSELVSAVLKRFMTGWFHPGFVEAVRAPLVLLLFGLSVGLFVNQLQVFHEATLDRNEVIQAK